MKKLLAKATALYEKGRYQAAMTVARKVLAIEKDNDAALFYVAHGLYYAKQYRRSLQYWKRLRSLCPTELHVNLNMGACYDDLGESALAIKYYKQELELNPIEGKALYNLGALYYKTHRYKLAAHFLERCYSQKFEVSACVSRLAHAYFKTGQLEKEQMLYEEYLQTNPDNSWALNNLGSHLMGQGKYNCALIRLTKAARIGPNDKLVQKNIRKAQRMIKKLKKDKITD